MTVPQLAGRVAGVPRAPGLVLCDRKGGFVLAGGLVAGR